MVVPSNVRLSPIVVNTASNFRKLPMDMRSVICEFLDPPHICGSITTEKLQDIGQKLRYSPMMFVSRAWYNMYLLSQFRELTVATKDEWWVDSDMEGQFKYAPRVGWFSKSQEDTVEKCYKAVYDSVLAYYPPICFGARAGAGMPSGQQLGWTLFQSQFPKGYSSLRGRLDAINQTLSEKGICHEGSKAYINLRKNPEAFFTRIPQNYSFPKKVKSLYVAHSQLRELTFGEWQAWESIKLKDNPHLQSLNIQAKMGCVQGAQQLRQVHITGLEGMFRLIDCPKVDRVYVEGSGTLELMRSKVAKFEYADPKKVKVQYKVDWEPIARRCFQVLLVVVTLFLIVLVLYLVISIIIELLFMGAIEEFAFFVFYGILVPLYLLKSSTR